MVLLICTRSKQFLSSPSNGFSQEDDFSRLLNTTNEEQSELQEGLNQ